MSRMMNSFPQKWENTPDYLTWDQQHRTYHAASADKNQANICGYFFIKSNKKTAVGVNHGGFVSERRRDIPLISLSFRR